MWLNGRVSRCQVAVKRGVVTLPRLPHSDGVMPRTAPQFVAFASLLVGFGAAQCHTTPGSRSCLKPAVVELVVGRMHTWLGRQGRSLDALGSLLRPPAPRSVPRADVQCEVMV